MQTGKSQNPILIVDDTLAITRQIYTVLRDIGVPLEDRPSGEMALKELAHRRFRLILLDYMLPGANGLEILKQIKQIDPKATVIFMTGSGSERVAVQAMKNGAADYIVKDADFASNILKVVMQQLRGGDAAA